ncbi:MAG TPA: type II toxin-antitoxin system death-on-curing family toxin [Candidatus Omnitrophota bacterium]|nr:type II toxin-antitoxin system death-on-curing family toxin [Candidatus Omnitrophota bacterium]
MDWIWVLDSVVQAVHDAQLAEHGGGHGVRDAGLLESALARPKNTAAYGSPELADLAAAYAFGICRNHPFVDGNKRTALVVMELFLDLNGVELTASDEDCVATFTALAAGELGEAELAAWVRRFSLCQPES